MCSERAIAVRSSGVMYASRLTLQMADNLKYLTVRIIYEGRDGKYPRSDESALEIIGVRASSITDAPWRAVIENLGVATGGDRMNCGFESSPNAEGVDGDHAGSVGQLVQRGQGYAAKDLLAEPGARFSAPISRLRSTRAPTSLAIPLREERPGRLPLPDDPMCEPL